MLKHNLFAPSSAERWSECPYSTTLMQKVGLKLFDHSTDKAFTGTQIHEAFEALCKRQPIPMHFSEEVRSLALAAYRQFNEFIESMKTPDHVAGSVHFHHEMKLDLFVPGLKHNFGGTTDVLAVPENKKWLLILDLKGGHVPVSPIKNKQLTAYAMAAMQHFKIDVLDAIPITFAIIQPRLDEPLKIWETNALEVQITFNESVKTLKIPGALKRPRTGKHCHYCPVKQSCHAFKNRLNLVIQFTIDSEIAHEQRALSAPR